MSNRGSSKTQKPKTTFAPLACPHCGEELWEVHETTYDTYRFDDATGGYKEGGYAMIHCGSCGGDLRDMVEFHDGCCNYVPVMSMYLTLRFAATSHTVLATG